MWCFSIFQLLGFGELPQTFSLESVESVHLTELPHLTYIVFRDPGDHELRALVHDVLDVEEVGEHCEVGNIVNWQLQWLGGLVLKEV